MTARVLDPAILASSIRAEVRAAVAQLGEPLTLAGFLVADHGPSATYAEYTRRGCEDVGIRFDLRAHRPHEVEQAVRAAGGDSRVHGVLIYYPVLGSESDRWLRELVDPRKDVEGLHSFWAHCLYENRRFIDDAGQKRAILPCTPLAIRKLLDEALGERASADGSLAGLKACIFNRSEVVGYPLAAMMANDGAHVTSFDIEGALEFVPSEATHRVLPSSLDRASALAQADIVITGVPSREFKLVTAREIKPGAVCINFSTLRNYTDDVVQAASAFVPRVGPMTVTMALRNALRLHHQFHA
jgi:methylenetetrahydrofolate dehydrogenase (NADP+)/methenyltetrahydrofolate cyclohydrolase